MTSAVDLHFIIRLLITIISILTLVRLYYRFSFHRENAASFILFGIGVFLVSGLLHQVDVSMGFAFGLFAVFSMLRYRTEALGIKEMTYLFLVIAIALLGAVGNLPHWQLTILNIVIVATALCLESKVLLPMEKEQSIEYEKIENIRPENKDALMDDLKTRTGLNITRIEVTSINFLRDTAMLRVHYSSAVS